MIGMGHFHQYGSLKRSSRLAQQINSLDHQPWTQILHKISKQSGKPYIGWTPNPFSLFFIFHFWMITLNPLLFIFSTTTTPPHGCYGENLPTMQWAFLKILYFLLVLSRKRKQKLKLDWVVPNVKCSLCRLFSCPDTTCESEKINWTSS